MTDKELKAIQERYLHCRQGVLAHTILSHAQDDTSALLAEIDRLTSQKPPCSPNCYHHQTHPCEQCGRIGGYLPVVLRDKDVERLREALEKMFNEFRNSGNLDKDQLDAMQQASEALTPTQVDKPEENNEKQDTQPQ